MSKIFKFVYIYCLLIKFDLKLRSKGFPKVFDMYVSKYEDIEIFNYKIDEVEKVNEEIKELLVLVELACVFYPANAKCIHKSFLSYRFLRKKYKVPIKLVIGVSHFPFEAHAWIMQGKYNIGEDAIDTERYKIILDSSDYQKGGALNEVVSR